MVTLSRDRLARARQRIGVVHQDCQFLDHLPLADNGRIAADGDGPCRDGRAEPARSAGLGGVEGSGGATAAELSAANGSAPALARAVITQPEVILAE